MTHSFPPRLSSDIVVFAEPRRSRAKPVGPAPHALCFAAESPRGRRRAQPPRPDRRNGTRHQRRKPQRRYIVGQEGAAAQPAAEHLADDARIALIAALLSRQLPDRTEASRLGQECVSKFRSWW